LQPRQRVIPTSYLLCPNSGPVRILISRAPTFSIRFRIGLRSWLRLLQPLRCRGRRLGAPGRHPPRTDPSVSKVSRLPYFLPSGATGSGSVLPLSPRPPPSCETTH